MVFGNGKQNPVPADIQFFLLFDTKAETYRDPLMSTNRETMVREIANSFQDPRAAQAPHVLNPEDFQLFSCGEYRRATGELKGWPPVHVANVHEIATTVRSKSGPQGIVAT